jgi:hypothetical protein
LNITEFKVKEETIISPKKKDNIEDAEIVEDNTDQTVFEGLTLQTLANECLDKLAAKEEIKLVLAHFNESVGKVTDITDKEKKNASALWGKNVMAPFNKKREEEKNKPADTEISPEEKEKIVTAAQEAAEAGKEEVIPSMDEVKQISRSVIKDAITAGKSALNAFNKYISKGTVKKAIKANNIKPDPLFKELKSEVEKEAPQKIKLFETIDVKTVDPTVWDAAIACKTIEDFQALVIDLVIVKNMWPIAGNLVQQYLNTYPGFDKHDEETKTTWFKDLIKTEKEKKVAAEVTAPAEQPAQATDVPTADKSAPVADTTKSKDFSDIKKESDKKRLIALISSFIKDRIASGKTFEETKADLRPLLKDGKVYKNAKDNELDNAINKIAKNNPEIAKLLA